MKEKPLPDVLPLLKEAIDQCAQETAPAYLQNRALLEENAKLYHRVQEMYTRSQHLRTDVAVNNQKLRNAHQSLQRKIDELLPAMARAFARRDDAFYDIKDILFQENYIAFYEQHKDFFEEPKNANDPGIVAQRSLVAKYKEERELREQVEKEEEKRLLGHLQKEVEKPLTLAVVLKPLFLVETLNDHRLAKQRLWEENIHELYIPLFWERRHEGLMDNLNRALLEAIPRESDISPSEYLGIMKIEVRHDHDDLWRRLCRLQPKDFDEANIHLHVLSIKDIIMTSGEEKPERKKKRFFRRNI